MRAKGSLWHKSNSGHCCLSSFTLGIKVIYLALHTHNPNPCLLPPHFCFPHELCKQSYLLLGWTHSSPKICPSLLQHWKPLIQQPHGISVCMFGHVSGCPSGLWKVSLEDGMAPELVHWAGRFGQKSQSLFLFPFRVLPVLSQSGKRHSSCSPGKSCSTSLSSDTFPQQPGECLWAQLLFCFRPNISLVLLALDMHEFCLEEKNHCLYSHLSCLRSSCHALQIPWKRDGRGEAALDTCTGSSMWPTLNWGPVWDQSGISSWQSTTADGAVFIP